LQVTGSNFDLLKATRAEGVNGLQSKLAATTILVFITTVLLYNYSNATYFQLIMSVVRGAPSGLFQLPKSLAEWLKLLIRKGIHQNLYVVHSRLGKPTYLARKRVY
jgi:hypothetical protein